MENEAQRSLVPARAYYFLYYAAAASLVPFLTLYYQSLGFSGSQIGLLAALSPLVSLVAAPFWGGVADASRRHKAVLFALMAGAWLSVLALSQASLYGLIALLVAAFAFFNAPLIPLVDHTVLALLGAHSDRYGQQRVWGAYGWGLAAPVTGWLAGQYGLLWAFIVYLIITGANLLVASRMVVLPAGPGQPFWRGLRRLLADPRWFLFLFIVFLSGAGLSVITNFLFLYLDDLHASRAVMGLALSVATLSEIPVLFFSGWMIRRWGTRGLLVLSLAAYVVRAFGLGLATAPWQALILQMLHGLTFSAMWVAGVSFANEIAPEGLGATAQGVFGSTVMGLGGITGALAGGLLLERTGSAGMFYWSGIAVLLGLGLFLAFGKTIRGSTG